MPYTLETVGALSRSDEGCYIRLDGILGGLEKPARKSNCFRLYRVWDDGINMRKYGLPNGARPQFFPSSKFARRVEVFTIAEFSKLPE